MFAFSFKNQCQHYYTLENPLPLGPLGLNAFNHPWTYQVIYVFPPPALVLLFLSKFLVEHVIGQFRVLVLVVPCWMEASCLPTVLSMFETISHWCPIINIVMDILIDWLLKGLPSLNLTLWLFRDVCGRDKGCIPKSVRQWWELFKHVQ